MSEKTILVVDDERNIRRSLEMILSGEGYRVRCAASGQEALDAVGEENVHVVLLDIVLPGMNGIEVLKSLRKNRPDLAVVMISGHGTVQDAVMATRLGAYDFLEKPLSREKVLLTISHALETVVLAQENRNLRQKIQGRKARHDFEHLATLAPIKPLTEAERQAMPPVWQPMVRQHPVTGRKSLFISPIYNNAVEGMDDNEAVALVAELTEIAGRDEFIYRHRWTADDIVMWDNRCTMHAVTPYDLGQRRVMHRATIIGDGPVIAA